MARTLEQILESEKVEVVAGAAAKAELMITTIDRGNDQASHDIGYERRK